jgi:hypothetical protein
LSWQSLVDAAPTLAHLLPNDLHRFLKALEGEGVALEPATKDLQAGAPPSQLGV